MFEPGIRLADRIGENPPGKAPPGFEEEEVAKSVAMMPLLQAGLLHYYLYYPNALYFIIPNHLLCVYIIILNILCSIGVVYSSPSLSVPMY